MCEPCQPPLIYWAIASTDTFLHRAANGAPLPTLAPSELAHLATLRHPLRRRDWLLGRWVARWLLQEVTHFGKEGNVSIAIEYEPSGAPIIRINGGRTGINLSISHCDGWAFCAITGDLSAHEPRFYIGADIERVRGGEDEQRAFLDLLTPDERTQVAQHDDPPALATAIWCAKEAAGKALRTGLGLNPDRFICRLEPEQGNPVDGWNSLTVTVDARTLPGWYRILELQAQEWYAVALVIC